MRTEQADVVILGGGAAGLSAALAAAEAGACVAVVSKVYPMRSHTVAAEGGAAGVHRESDSLDLHLADTLRAGAGLAEPAAVEYIVAQAPVELARLERMGMPFSRTDDGDVATRPFGGMSQPRTWFAADKTGFHLLHTLFQTALQNPNIKFFNEYQALNLLLTLSATPHPSSCAQSQDLENLASTSRDSATPTEVSAQNDEEDEGGVGNGIGVLTYSLGDGEPVLFLGRSVVLATGGYARAWGTSTNAAIVTGDGHALALRAGLPLRDMEFVQWHPTCLPGSGLLITEAARGEGGVLLDKNGQRYLADYGLGPETPIGHPEARKMELGPRDALSQAFIAAKADNRTRQLPYATLRQPISPTSSCAQSQDLENLPSTSADSSTPAKASAQNDDGAPFFAASTSSCAQSQDLETVRMIDVVDLDLTHLGASVLRERLPLVLELAKRYARVDATKQPIPICPAAHYTMGGVPTDVEARVLDAEGVPVPGLYAAGECASTGLHGANRLGSNSLVETLVMGRTAGTQAAAHSPSNICHPTSPAPHPSSCAQSQDHKRLASTSRDSALPLRGPQNDEVEHSAASAQNDAVGDAASRSQNDGMVGRALELWGQWAAMQGTGTENHYQLRAELGQVLDENFGIQLTGDGLAAAATTIGQLKARYQNVQVTDDAAKYNTDWQQAIELGFMLDCAEATIAAAQTRQESRGAFQRSDHPDQNHPPHHSLVTRHNGTLEVKHAVA